MNPDNTENENDNLRGKKDAGSKSSNSSLCDTSDSDSFYSCGSESFYSYSDEDEDNKIDPKEKAATGPEMSRWSEPGTSSDSSFNSQELETNAPHSQQIRRSSLVTPSFRYDRQKPENLFPPTKKYRYYPVTCEYCLKRFQPNKLKSHQRKHHTSATDEAKPARKVQSAAIKRGTEKQTPAPRSKSAGGMPRKLQICYICGQMYGSQSLKIHEPKCLDKWRIQNAQLPKDLRAPEPVKPEPQASIGTGKDGYDIPDFDPAAAAAYRSHLSTLIPCKHCSRTFSPDRIQKHMSCCIERPRSRIRRCKTPKGGEIPR